MKSSILSAFDSLPYFTTESVKQMAGDEALSAGTIQTALYRWMKTGHIVALKRGVYMTHRFFERHRSEAGFSPMVSAILIPGSYVSSEYILQRHGILSEVTYPVTAVTLKQPRVFENNLGTFSFRRIRNSLYTGFTISDFLGIPVCLASVPKALFDYFYFRPSPGALSFENIDIAEELRLNLDDLSEIDRDEFAGYVGLSNSRKMDLILRNLRKTVWRR